MSGRAVGAGVVALAARSLRPADAAADSMREVSELEPLTPSGEASTRSS